MNWKALWNIHSTYKYKAFLFHLVYPVDLTLDNTDIRAWENVRERPLFQAEVKDPREIWSLTSFIVRMWVCMLSSHCVKLRRPRGLTAFWVLWQLNLCFSVYLFGGTAFAGEGWKWEGIFVAIVWWYDPVSLDAYVCRPGHIIQGWSLHVRGQIFYGLIFSFLLLFLSLTFFLFYLLFTTSICYLDRKKPIKWSLVLCEIRMSIYNKIQL